MAPLAPLASSGAASRRRALREARAARRPRALALVAALIALAALVSSSVDRSSAAAPLDEGTVSGHNHHPRRRALLASASGACAANPAPAWIVRGGWVLYALAILYLFLGVAVTCDDFFAPSLERVCERLDLSEDVAGATFMAAGSSAPELFTSTMSLVSRNATNELGVATIVGSAVFNILVIVAASVACADKPLALDPRPVKRDCAFYAAAIATVMGVMADGVVHWYEGLASVAMYGGYVYYLVRQNRARVEPDAARTSASVSGGGSPRASVSGASVSGGGFPEKQPLDRRLSDDAPPSTPGPEGNPGRDVERGAAMDSASVAIVAFGPGEGASAKARRDETDDDVSSSAHPSRWAAFANALSSALCAPWYLALRATCPDVSDDARAHLYLVAFFSSVVWISVISYGMVESASALGCALKVPEVVMGTLVLAAGTSVPDALSSVAVARAGQGDMAVANAVGSNVFDVWLGLGLPWLLVLPGRGGSEAVGAGGALWPSVVLLAAVLAGYYGTLLANGFTLRKRHGVGFLVAYVAFVAYSVAGVWWADLYGVQEE